MTTTITEAEKQKAAQIAKTTTTHLSDARETGAILAGLSKAKDEGIMADSLQQTSRKAAQGVINYLRDNKLVLPADEQTLLINKTKDFARDVMHPQGR